MPQTPARRYQSTVHYLQHKVSALQAITRASAGLQAAYLAVTVGRPSIRLLEDARADIELALREARGMANLDDATVGRSETAATGEAAA
jgi:hypothetical protein